MIGKVWVRHPLSYMHLKKNCLSFFFDWCGLASSCWNSWCSCLHLMCFWGHKWTLIILSPTRPTSFLCMYYYLLVIHWMLYLSPHSIFPLSYKDFLKYAWIMVWWIRLIFWFFFHILEKWSYPIVTKLVDFCVIRSYSLT